MEEQSQQQQTFTFASSVSSSETYQDASAFDYQSWIEQSKISNCLGDKLYLGETINNNHLLRDMPEEAYELSLRDFSELSLSRFAAEEAANSSVRPNSNKKPRRKPRNKIPSMERVGLGLIIKLFMPRAAATGRTKSFSGSAATMSVNGGSMQNAVSETKNEPNKAQSNSLPIKRYQDCTNRKSTVCYPLFNSKKYKVKRGGHFDRTKLEAED